MTDIYYKTPNTYDYVPHNSAHSSVAKVKLPYKLPKQVIVFIYFLIKIK